MTEMKTLTLPDGSAFEIVDDSARNRLGKIEYQPVTTELADTHSDLPAEKTVAVHSNGAFGDTAYINYGEDLIPKGGMHRQFPYNGITIVKTGEEFKITGTNTGSVVTYFTDKYGAYNIPVPEDMIGKTVKILTFANAVIGSYIGVQVQFFDADLTQLSRTSMYIASSKVSNSKTCTVPEGTAYMRWSTSVSSAAATFDHTFKVFAALEENLQTVTLTGITEVADITAASFSTYPYSSTASYTLSLRQYIDAHSGGDKSSGSLIATYLTPEQFGAVGDGSTDDSAAITACIEEAVLTGQTVFMAKTYRIASPIDVTQSGLDLIINDLVYTGTDAAVKIHGKQNSLKIHSVASSGVGIQFLGDSDTVCCQNTVDVNTITSGSHGIEFIAPTTGVYQNVVRFAYIKAGGDGCNGICRTDVEDGSWCTENTFYGGQIANCDWAVYNIAGTSKLYGIQVEEKTKGGFYITGNVQILNPRWAESSRDGEYPFFKFAAEDAKYARIISGVALAINEIDLTDNADTFISGSGAEFPMHEHRFTVLDFPLTCRLPAVGENGETPVIYTMRSYVWGKFLIMTPHMAYRKAITTETLDTRLIGRTEETTEDTYALSQLPTKFVVDSINTEIFLHASYCAFGFNEFEVEQANGCTCKIYDCLENLIFDGTEHGDGIYKFNVYKDSDKCTTYGSGLLRRDFLGHYWQVLKLGATVI